MFSLTEASTRRRVVAVGRPIAASAGSILAGQSFMMKVTQTQHLDRRSAPEGLRDPRRPLVQHRLVAVCRNFRRHVSGRMDCMASSSCGELVRMHGAAAGDRGGPDRVPARLM